MLWFKPQGDPIPISTFGRNTTNIRNTVVHDLRVVSRGLPLGAQSNNYSSTQKIPAIVIIVTTN